MPVAKKSKPKSVPTWRELVLEHINEIFAGLIGFAIIVSATVAAIFKVLDPNALAFILGTAAGAGGGFAAGKSK